MSKQSGQVQLVIVLVVSAISLVLGAAVTQRAVSNLKQTTYTAQAARAQKAADAGAEEALAVVDLSTWLGSHAVDLGGGSTATYTVTQSGGGSAPIQFSLDKDQTTQIDLTGYGSGQAVNLYWVSGPTEEANKAALVLSFIYDDAGTTKLEKHANDPDGTRRTANNFSAPTGGSYSIGGKIYNYRASINTPSGTNRALRVRPLYNGTPNSFAIERTGTNTFPTQGHQITSTGTYGEAQWTVEVTKMNPSLPAIFDYAIFSESDLTK